MVRRWWPLAVGVTVALTAVTTAIIGARANVARIAQVCHEQLCAAFEQPTQPTLDLLSRVGIGLHTYAVGMNVIAILQLLVFAVIGVVVVHRRATLLAFMTLLFLVGNVSQPFVDGLAAHTRTAEVAVAVGLSVAQVSTLLLLALFPDDRWHPAFLRRWWLAVAVVLVTAALTYRLGLEAQWYATVGDIVFVALIAAQVHRYFRVSDRTARQQAKWVLIGFALLAANVVAANVLNAFGVLARAQLLIVLVAYVAFTLMAVGFAFALLRYRLFDVDLVLRRTVLYSVSVVVLLAAYLGLVALASLSMARSSASMVGAAVVAGLALGLALVLGRVRETFRTRFLAARGRPGGVAALLADQSRDAEPAKQLARTIAKALDLRYVAVFSHTGDVLSSHGTEPADGGIRQPVDDGSGTPIGTLVLGPASGRRLNRRDKSTLREVLPFVLLVLRAEREAELLRQARRATATSREDERQRLRRDLHDGVGPLLASQLLALDSMRVSRGREPDADTEEILSLLESQSRAAIAEIRAITRNLRPAVLDTQGLAGALEEEVERLRVGGLDVDLHMNVDAAGPPGLSAAAEVSILRIVQEALTNVLRHARASSAHIAVTADGRELAVVVDDDGVGIPAAGVASRAGVGTGSMRQRAEELGGSLTISQGPGGRGTRVHARIPL